MIIEFTVQNLEAVGLGPMDSPQRVVVKGRVNYRTESRSFGMRCREWLEMGYTVTTWKSED